MREPDLFSVIAWTEEQYLPMERYGQVFGVVPLVAGIVTGGAMALYPYSRPGTAVSAEARTIRAAAMELACATERSQVLFGARQSLLNDIRAIAEECSETDWDGNGATPASPAALQMAEDIVRSLPEEIPLPEVAPEPDGSVSLDWIRGPYRVYSLSVGPVSRLAYAWLDGSDKGHGVVGFDGMNLPSRVLSDIQRTIADDDAAVRSA